LNPGDYNDIMSTTSVELEALFQEGKEPVGAKPPKMRYSHEAMADLLVQNPWITQNQVAAHFGYTASWVSTIITSDAFQSLLASRREEVVDPVLRATLEERFRGLVHRSLQILAEKLDRPAAVIPDQVVLRALELGAKGIELGGFGRPQMAPPAPADPNRLEQLANRLVELQSKVRSGNTYEAETVEIILTKGEVHEAGEETATRGEDKDLSGSKPDECKSAEGAVRAEGPGPGETA
jgi:hypothetical protein